MAKGRRVLTSGLGGLRPIRFQKLKALGEMLGWAPRASGEPARAKEYLGHLKKIAEQYSDAGPSAESLSIEEQWRLAIEREEKDRLQELVLHADTIPFFARVYLAARRTKDAAAPRGREPSLSVKDALLLQFYDSAYWSLETKPCARTPWIDALAEEFCVGAQTIRDYLAAVRNGQIRRARKKGSSS